MSTKIFNNILCKNLKNSKYIQIYPSHRSLDKSSYFTKYGDSGRSKIYAGDLEKNHVIFEAIGVTEELITFIGLAREYILDNEKLTPIAEKLRKIQLVLIDTTDIISNLQPSNSSVKKDSPLQVASTAKVTQGDIADLEALITHYGTFLPQVEKVIVPGGGKASATLHVAKSVCRRCERILVSVLKDIESEKNILVFINRLSSYLSQAARISAKFANRPESIYKPHIKGESNASNQ